MNVDGSNLAHTHLFQHQWSIYQWALDTDAMGHQYIVEMSRVLMEKYYRGAIGHFLDLGCGSGFIIPALVSGFKLQSYTGVDQCTGALAQAQQTLRGVFSDIHFIESDLFELPFASGSEFDVIFSSYAIHHGSFAKKQSLFRALRQKIHDHGIFIFVDIIKYEQQSSVQYLQQVERYFKSFPDLSSDRCNTIIEHVDEFDFPETSTNYIDMAEKAGWQLLELHQLDLSEQFPVALMVFGT